MRNRVERLRVWLLGSAVLLILVIAAFIGTAHYLRHRFLGNFPAKLGANIVREMEHPGFCHTVQGRTDYCIHAAKSIEHTDGVTTLHDVSIVIYGKKSDRSDRIYGDEFEYDQKAQVIRAKGVVHIDLQAAATPGKPASGKVMHVTTSGLVYLQNLGVAATNEYIEFQSGDITGHATGGDYASDSGLLVLHSAVSMNGAAGGRPFGLTAATAQFDDHSQQAFLTRPTYESEGRTAVADQATLYRRLDGTLSRIQAQGDVKVEAQGATVISQKADVALTATSQPQTAVLTGAVKYSADQDLRQVRGDSDVATIDFDSQAKPQPQHAVFTGAVHMNERTRVTDAAKEPWSTRDLTAARLETELAPAGPGKSELRDAEATGNPRMTLVNKGSLANSSNQGTTELTADDLKAHFVAVSDAKESTQLDTLMGRGHTVLRQMSVDGVDQTSTGDTLDAKFRPKAAKQPAPGNTSHPAAGKQPVGGGVSVAQNLGDTVLDAVQQGHVTIVRTAPAKSQRAAVAGAKPGPQPAANTVERAKADRAVYDGDRDTMTLSGGTQVMDAGSVLWADQVTLDHDTGNAHASGAVKMNYVQDASAQTPPRNGTTSGAPGSTAQPTHVLAERAELEHETGIATFYGRPARMWQDGNQVQAPVIEFSQAQKRLIARSDAGTGWSTAPQAEQVRTVLVQTGSDGPASGQASARPATGGSAAAGCSASPQAKPVSAKSGTTAGVGAVTSKVVRIASGGLVYSDIQRQADFTGGFRADTSDGTIQANEGVVFLEPKRTLGTGNASAGAAVAGPSLTGELDHIVATGHVELNQPGMQATGERLVYTASDRTALLTGDKGAPPKAVDAQGTTTGAALRFRSSCDGIGSGTVEVLGAPGQRVQTDARLADDGKREKAKR